MANDESPQPEMNEAVGQQLQRAREKSGLSAADIADAQHLRPVVIQAIECGDYSKIDSELFLKGYVRAYAVQVGLDADAVISDLDKELEPLRQEREQEHEANPLVDIERRRHRKLRVAKLLLILAALVLAGYLAFAFLMPGNTSEESTTGAQESAQPQENEEAGNTVTTSAPEEPAVDESETAVSALDATAPADEAVENPVEAPVPGSDDLDEAMPEDAGQLAVDAQPVFEEPEPVLADPAETAVVTDNGRLQITFTGDCWVQVSDASGVRLVNSLQRSGDQVDVSGAAPLKVVIGAVDAVGSIRFQGDSLDMGDYPAVNNRSEFTLTI